jgi:hypothetical protein
MLSAAPRKPTDNSVRRRPKLTRRLCLQGSRVDYGDRNGDILKCLRPAPGSHDDFVQLGAAISGSSICCRHRLRNRRSRGE